MMLRQLKRRIERLDVDGFAVGVDVHDVQYGLTVKGLQVYNATVAAIRTDQNMLNIDHWAYHSDVPALIATDRKSAVTLAGGHAFIKDDALFADWAGTLYFRGVEFAHTTRLRFGGNEIPVKNSVSPV